MQTLLPFAYDSDGLWFAWCVKGARKSLQRVLVFDDRHDAAPPRAIAESFDDFLHNVALGTRMSELRIRRERNVSDGEEENSDDDGDGDGRLFVPRRVFVKFAQR